jgi:hypothetical protein
MSFHQVPFRGELNAAALSYGWGLPIFVAAAAAPRTETVERRAVEQIRLEQRWRPSLMHNMSSAASGLSIIPACAVAGVAIFPGVAKIGANVAGIVPDAVAFSARQRPLQGRGVDGTGTAPTTHSSDFRAGCEIAAKQSICGGVPGPSQRA